MDKLQPQPKDLQLYNKIKKQMYKKYPKHSAYRSGIIVKKYKEEYEKKYNNKNAYTNSKKNGTLNRWFKEVWVNESGKVGYDKKNTLYRPKYRITKDTPITWKELNLNKKEIKKAEKCKKKNGRINRFVRFM